jgi:uncharacterized protein YxeA
MIFIICVALLIQMFCAYLTYKKNELDKCVEQTDEAVMRTSQRERERLEWAAREYYEYRVNQMAYNKLKEPTYTDEDFRIDL